MEPALSRCSHEPCYVPNRRRMHTNAPPAHTLYAPGPSKTCDIHPTNRPPTHASQDHINKTNTQLAQEPKTKIAFDITNLRMIDDRHARNFSSLPAFVIEKMGPNVTNSGALDPTLFTMAGYFQKATEQLGQRGFGYTIAVVPNSVQELLMSWNADPQWLEFKFKAGELPHDLSAGIISTLYKKKKKKNS